MALHALELTVYFHLPVTRIPNCVSQVAHVCAEKMGRGGGDMTGGVNTSWWLADSTFFIAFGCSFSYFIIASVLFALVL